ncbi:hypothetical protein CFP56_002210 [Quercus suber]|uniref:Uncharacterized protein n=1 Tax=Quercus suber TaxID=58331 RepID=A0AAW0M775_QUESU
MPTTVADSPSQGSVRTQSFLR